MRATRAYSTRVYVTANYQYRYIILIFVDAIKIRGVAMW